MHRGLVILSALVLLLATTVGVASADTSGGCTGATQCRTSGTGVDGSWSSVPVDGPVIGQIYTDTYVAASKSMTSSRGVRTSTAGLWFSQFTYRFDGPDQKPTPIGDSFVVDFGTDLVVTIDGKLRTASVSGTAMVVSCTIDSDYNETCGDPVATAVRGTWTATGPALKTTYSYRAKGPGFTMSDSFSGTQRAAAAAVTIDGNAVPGTSYWASISNSKSRSISICHAITC
ncbi:MAG: hypothetical protein ABI573_05755 [Chloroflexota bacterium]